MACSEFLPRVHGVFNALTACTRRSYSWIYKQRLFTIIDQFLLVMTGKRTIKRTRPRLTSPPPLDQNRCNATQHDPDLTPTDKNPTPSPRPVRDDSPCSMSSRESSLSNPSTSHISLTHPQKKAKTTTDLTVTQEEDMASWREVNDLIYNKKLNADKNFRKKYALWEFKAAGMDKDVDILKAWYRSIRTRFTRLVHRKSRSGDSSSELTERDRWILQNFAWLRVHVVEVKKKTTVCVATIKTLIF